MSGGLQSLRFTGKCLVLGKSGALQLLYQWLPVRLGASQGDKDQRAHSVQ